MWILLLAVIMVKNEENENVLQPENTKDTLSQKVISFSSI